MNPELMRAIGLALSNLSMALDNTSGAVFDIAMKVEDGFEEEINYIGKQIENVSNSFGDISDAVLSQVALEEAKVHDLDKLKPVKKTDCCGSSCKCKEDGK